MERIAIEDDFNDIVTKAMNGRRITDADLSARSGVALESVRSIARGVLPDEVSLARVAPVLGLEPNSLVRSAMKLYYPRPVEVEGVELFNSRYHGGMTVNAFLVWDPATRAAAVFDTGTDALPLVDRIAELGLKPVGLFLTHTHPDHVAEVDALTGRLGIGVYSNEREPYAGSETFEEGATFAIGELEMTAATTWGHSKGGTTYVIHGLERPVAVVGDAVFAGSMGGGMVSFADALETNRRRIFTLPDNTVICPGHGPLTSVAEEKRNNPFFAGEFLQANA